MNKTVKRLTLSFAAFLTMTSAGPARAQSPMTPADTRSEQFYMISSVDMQKHQIVLMRPTQLTVVATTNDQTAYLGEQGQKVALKDLRAGQTVWATTHKDKSGQVVAVRVRAGAMTVTELHKLFLDYPVK